MPHTHATGDKTPAATPALPSPGSRHHDHEQPASQAQSAALDHITHGWSRPPPTGRTPVPPHQSDRQRTIRNRRFTYLHRSLLASDYFSPQSMHLRNPILFRCMFPELDGPPRPTGGSAAEFPNNGVIASLFDAMDHERAVEVEREAEGRVGEEESESESEGDEEGSGKNGEQSPNPIVDDIVPAGSDERDAAERMSELIRTMAERWLDGYDAEFFDYSQVDSNSEYDNVEQVNQDAQDNWFADDESNIDVQCTDTGELDY